MHEKGCIRIEERSRRGHLVRVLLPSEMEGLIPDEGSQPTIDIESVDFFKDRRYADNILKRESGRCFYCLHQLMPEACELDHAVPQVSGGNNSLRNIVASCHECNTLKQGATAEDFLRNLYRKAVLSQTELQDRLSCVARLAAGELVPEI